MDYRFKIASQAKRDLNSIWRYVARTNASNALDFGDKLLLMAESLKTFPHRHGQLAKRPNIRKVPYRSYLTFYKIDDKARTVEILRFWHAARDQRRLRLKEAAPVYSSAIPAV